MERSRLLIKKKVAKTIQIVSQEEIRKRLSRNMFQKFFLTMMKALPIK